MLKPAENKEPGEVTQLLRRLREGDRPALDELFVLVYGELRRLAHCQLRRERAGHTLYPTALVHEAYMKLAEQGAVACQNRAHFLGVAARAMRQILTDYARKFNAAKRGGEWHRTTITNKQLPLTWPLEELIALDSALDSLEKLDERLCKVVEYGFFGGMEEEEIAGLLGVSSRTVRRDWVRARAWLYKELYPTTT